MAIESGVARALTFLFAVVTGERDEPRAGHGRFGAQGARNRVAVDVRQADVAQHEIGANANRCRDAFATGVCRRDVVPQGADDLLHEIGGVYVILYDDDVLHTASLTDYAAGAKSNVAVLACAQRLAEDGCNGAARRDERRAFA